MHTTRPESGPKKPCYMGVFLGLIFHISLPLAPHIVPLLLAQSNSGANRGTIPLPPIPEKGPAAYRAMPGFRHRPLGGQRRLQRGIKGLHCLPEVAAISTRPAFAQHIAPPIQKQAAVFLAVVCTPLYHKGADGCPFLPGQFAGHSVTSRCLVA